MLSICSNCCILYEQIKSHSERISNIKPFIDQYDWKEINSQSNKKDCIFLSCHVRVWEWIHTL